jgi:hypothetical protein
MKEWLSNYKIYLGAAAAVIAALLAYSSGTTTGSETLLAILGALYAVFNKHETAKQIRRAVARR